VVQVAPGGERVLRGGAVEAKEREPFVDGMRLKSSNPALAKKREGADWFINPLRLTGLPRYQTC